MMLFSVAFITLSALVGFGSCAPAPSAHQKRNVCTITGWWYIYEDPFQPGGDSDTYSGFNIMYQGGVVIGNTGDNPLHAITIGQDDTGLAESIEWTPDFAFGFSGCQASYEERGYNGYVNYGFPFPAGPGITGSACSVDFQCEGNL